NNKPGGSGSADAEGDWMILLNVARIDRLLHDRDGRRNHIAVVDGGEVCGRGRFGIGRNTRIALLAPGHSETVATDAFLEQRFHVVLLAASQGNASRRVLPAGKVSVVFATGDILLGDYYSSSGIDRKSVV